jgi:hypothetical protein
VDNGWTLDSYTTLLGGQWMDARDVNCKYFCLFEVPREDFFSSGAYTKIIELFCIVLLLITLNELLFILMIFKLNNRSIIKNQLHNKIINMNITYLT